MPTLNAVRLHVAWLAQREQVGFVVRAAERFRDQVVPIKVVSTATSRAEIDTHGETFSDLCEKRKIRRANEIRHLQLANVSREIGGRKPPSAHCPATWLSARR